ncbi:hypothetical protein AgCh_009463 [Apium graveolens]
METNNDNESWIGLPRYEEEYKKGIKAFVEKAFGLFSIGDELKCPRKDCDDRKWHRADVIYDHLICRGPSLSHVQWIYRISGAKIGNRTDFRDCEAGTIFGDNLQEMFDCTGRRLQNVEVGPNAEAKKFYRLVEEGKKPLYPGCTNFSRLSLMIRLYHLKCVLGITESGFSDLLVLTKEAFPEANVPVSFTAAKNIIKDLGLDYQKIHVCPNSCMLYWGKNKDKIVCDNYWVSRWVLQEKKGSATNDDPERIISKVPANIMRYFPLKPRLQRIFMFKEFSKLMTWHATGRIEDGKLRHPADAKAWKMMNANYPEFSLEIRNVRLGPSKEGVKRKFVTVHQFQQQQQKKKKANQKAPDLSRRILSPRQCKKQVTGTPENKEPVVNKNGSAMRKLNLQEDKSVAETDNVVEALAQPLPAKNPYEERRDNRVLENRAKLKELGLDKYFPDPNPPTAQINKKKDQVEEELDEYILEYESEEEDSEDSSKDPVPAATCKKASKKDLAKKGVESSSARKLLNPTCSKLLKQCGDIESGSVAAYVALRGRQKQNLELEPRIEDVGESSLPNVDEGGEPAPKKFRGRSKMLKVHERSSNEKVVITLSKRNQPIGDKKVTSKLSNFLGTLVKDHMSIAHVNWHVVPQDLKKKMVEYTLERYDIPPGGLKWINKILNTCWRVHKSRVKKEHYTKYDSNELRIENRPLDIRVKDFKLLLKYWIDEGVQSSIQEVLEEGNDVNELLPNGRHGPDWLITQELKAKFNRKLQDKMAWMLKKLGEANMGMNIDVGNFCATESSDHDENDTPFASGTHTPGTEGTRGQGTEGTEGNTI